MPPHAYTDPAERRNRFRVRRGVPHALTIARHRVLVLLVLVVAVLTGRPGESSAISGSAGTGEAAVEQHRELSDGPPLGAGRPDRRNSADQPSRQLRAVASASEGLPLTGWTAGLGLSLGFALMITEYARKRRLRESARRR